MIKVLVWLSIFLVRSILSNNWFEDQNDSAIKSLGVRYSPEINVELEICKYFELFSKIRNI